MKRAVYVIVLCLTLTDGWSDAATFVVDGPRDSHDAVPGDGVAADQSDSSCSLRAAIEEADALMGADTIFIPVDLGPFYLSLGPLRLQDDKTMIAGLGGRPVVDGVNNPVNLPSFMIEADSCQISGLWLRRSRGDAITVFGAGNTVGGDIPGSGLILTGNCLDNSNGASVRFSGPAAVGNALAGSYVGISANGVTPDGKAHGVIIDNLAANNVIGGRGEPSRNVISGNDGWGMVLSGGAHHNEVSDNYIGPDYTGNTGPGNALGGIVLLGGANNNMIGGSDLSAGNLVSGNPGPGIKLSGTGVYGNVINGNLIGISATGFLLLGNSGDGVLIADGSHHNTIGGSYLESGNLISDNGGNGIHLTGAGVSGNLIRANWIGLSLSGYGSLGNGWVAGDGILVDSGATANVIGGDQSTLRNVISSNYRFGVQLEGVGTNDNLIMGNYIGLNATGTSSSGNAAGVVISGGAQHNIVGGSTPASGNVISGNRSDDFPYGCGVLISGTGTQYNQVSANIIGLNAEGLSPRRNGSCGIIIGGGAQHNLIGGDYSVTGNVISGNGVNEPVEGRAAGIHIFGTSTAYNRIEGNLIGFDPSGQVVHGNIGHGIGIFSGAHDNTIGGETSEQGNRIAGSQGAGVLVSGLGTRGNLIRYNSLSNNLGLGIDVRDAAQDGIWPPEFTQVEQLNTAGPRYVAGRNAPPGTRIDIYSVGSPDPAGAGEGEIYLANTTADGSGDFETFLPVGPAIPIILTAVATDLNNNSSAFSVNGYSPDALPVEEPDELLPMSFSLSQNYPNPFNATTRIAFSLPRKGLASVTIYNTLGRRVRTLASGVFPAGDHELVWDARDDSGVESASGVYFYDLTSGAQRFSRKMVLLK